MRLMARWQTRQYSPFPRRTLAVDQDDDGVIRSMSRSRLKALNEALGET
jgi:hypothetical protein